MPRRALLVILGIAAVLGSGAVGLRYGRSSPPFHSAGPLTVTAVVGGDAIVVAATVAGRVRLVAAQEGDIVQAGQLVAWLEAPELREAVRAAERAVRDAQRRLELRRADRPSRLQEVVARAEAEAAAARRALEDAEQLSRELPLLTERVAAARAAQVEADLALASAKAALAEVRPANTSSGLTSETRPDASSSPAETSTSHSPESPEIARAAEAVEQAQRKKAAADAELAEAQRLLARAERATARLSALSSQAMAAQARAEELRSRLAEQNPDTQTDQDAEATARRELRDTQALAAQARARLQQAVVVAPATGLVEQVSARAGMELAAGEPLLTLRQLDPAWAEATLLADHANRVHRKQQVIVQPTGDATNPLQVEGEVTELFPESTNPQSAWTVRVTFPNPDHRLLPGTSVQLVFR